jgi:hypothetical protein
MIFFGGQPSPRSRHLTGYGRLYYLFTESIGDFSRMQTLKRDIKSGFLLCALALAVAIAWGNPFLVPNPAHAQDEAAAQQQSQAQQKEQAKPKPHPGIVSRWSRR